MTGHGRNKDPANNAHPRGSGVTGMGRRPIGQRGAGLAGRCRVPREARSARGGLHTRRHGLKNDYLDQAFGLGTRGAGDGRGAGTGVRHRSGAGPGRGESGRQRLSAQACDAACERERGGHPARARRSTWPTARPSRRAARAGGGRMGARRAGQQRWQPEPQARGRDDAGRMAGAAERARQRRFQLRPRGCRAWSGAASAASC